MAALAALVAVFAVGPPSAYVATDAAHVPLAISAWCWKGHCGAPISASKRIADVKRGRTVTVELRFVPRSVSVYVDGIRTRAATHGHEVAWVAGRGGGLTIRAVSLRGWVTYVGRLRLH